MLFYHVFFAKHFFYKSHQFQLLTSGLPHSLFQLNGKDLFCKIERIRFMPEGQMEKHTES